MAWTHVKQVCKLIKMNMHVVLSANRTKKKTGQPISSDASRWHVKSLNPSN